jgi:hypothetical protein
VNSERDKVVPYDIGFQPEAGVSGPVLLQTDYDAFLTFNAVKMMPDGSRGTTGTGVIEIERCSATKFGYPNDEALGGHPLFSCGLGFYGVFEVLGSSWIEQMTAQNRVCFPKTEDSTNRHFIFTFHDSTFECIADSLRALLSTEPYKKIHAQICQSVFRNATAD